MTTVFNKLDAEHNPKGHLSAWRPDAHDNRITD